MCGHFILLNLYNILFMQLSLSICHCFYKNILKSKYKTQPIRSILIIDRHGYTYPYINNTLMFTYLIKFIVTESPNNELLCFNMNSQEGKKFELQKRNLEL